MLRVAGSIITPLSAGSGPNLSLRSFGSETTRRPNFGEARRLVVVVDDSWGRGGGSALQLVELGEAGRGETRMRRRRIAAVFAYTARRSAAKKRPSREGNAEPFFAFFFFFACMRACVRAFDRYSPRRARSALHFSAAMSHRRSCRRRRVWDASDVGTGSANAQPDPRRWYGAASRAAFAPAAAHRESRVLGFTLLVVRSSPWLRPKSGPKRGRANGMLGRRLGLLH